MGIMLTRPLPVVVLLAGCAVGAPEPDAAQQICKMPTTRHDQARFSVAWELIRMADNLIRPSRFCGLHEQTEAESSEDAKTHFRVALGLLKKNIEATPQAEDIDYDHAWAAYCAARLGDHEGASVHYAYLREDHYGWLSSTGAFRNWDAKLREIRGGIGQSDDPSAKQTLSRMMAADEKAEKEFREEVMGLVREASKGGEPAVERLRHRRYHQALVDLLAKGTLALAPEAQEGTPTVTDGGMEQPNQRVQSDAASRSDGRDDGDR